MKLCQCLHQRGPFIRAGTLSGNPLAMTAGYTTLSILKNDVEIYARLADKTRYLAGLMKTALNEKGLDYQLNQLGSMMSLHFVKMRWLILKHRARGIMRCLKNIFTTCLITEYIFRQAHLKVIF